MGEAEKNRVREEKEYRGKTGRERVGAKHAWIYSTGPKKTQRGAKATVGTQYKNHEQRDILGKTRTENEGEKKTIQPCSWREQYF